MISLECYFHVIKTKINKSKSIIIPFLFINFKSRILRSSLAKYEESPVIDMTVASGNVIKAMII